MILPVVPLIMKVEVNTSLLKDNSAFKIGSSLVMMTPPINSDYWLFRVHLFKDQYVQAFPKFTTLGIGFALEDDWNTNLPYSQTPDDLYNHIEHNKKYDEITREMAIEAIALLSAACADYYAQTRKPD